MSMQHSQRAFENVKAIAAKLGSSADVARHISLDSIHMAVTAPGVHQVQAMHGIVKEAITNSVRARTGVLTVAADSHAMKAIGESAKVVRGKVFDTTWGSVDRVSIDVRQVMEKWAQSDPKGFSVVQNQTRGMAQDLVALGKISPASADGLAGSSVFGNSRMADFVGAMVAMEIKRIEPTAPALNTFKPQ